MSINYYVDGWVNKQLNTGGIRTHLVSLGSKRILCIPSPPQLRDEKRISDNKGCIRYQSFIAVSPLTSSNTLKRVSNVFFSLILRLVYQLY